MVEFALDYGTAKRRGYVVGQLPAAVQVSLLSSISRFFCALISGLLRYGPVLCGACSMDDSVDDQSVVADAAQSGKTLHVELQSMVHITGEEVWFHSGRGHGFSETAVLHQQREI